MAEVVDFQSKLKERVKEEQEGWAASDLTLQMLPIVARAISEMRELGADNAKIAKVLRHASDELARAPK